MILESFQQVQVIPAELNRVWRFFSDPHNLNAITPPDMQFRIISALPEHMYAGMLIQYQIRLLPGCWAKWLTEIRQVREGQYFCDEQRVGPYHLWYHEHHFEPVKGGVRMTDKVTYGVGYGPLGWLLHRVWIRPKLRAIFAYRTRKVVELFGEKS